MRVQRVLKGRSFGFTLVEIMIVVAIIGLLAAIAIPNYSKARELARRNTCLLNLKQLDGAKEQWALEKKVGAGAAVVEKEVNEFIKGSPKCPSGGTYSYGVVDAAPTCSVADHAL